MDMGDKEQLQELHDDYVWEVNAAVGEDRPDLALRLADDYLDRALELMTTGMQTGCGRADCAICRQPNPARTLPRRRAWRRRAWSRLTT
ncbi:MAG: hypothetical protein ABIQ59_16045 [Nocardioidaceae bacterium]